MRIQWTWEFVGGLNDLKCFLIRCRFVCSLLYVWDCFGIVDTWCTIHVSARRRNILMRTRLRTAIVTLIGIRRIGCRHGTFPSVFMFLVQCHCHCRQSSLTKQRHNLTNMLKDWQVAIVLQQRSNYILRMKFR